MHRETLADAQSSIDAGWIPDFFPSSARDIRERHDIDSNEIWISFAFDPQDLSWIDTACEPAASLSGPRRQPRWWPEALSGNVSKASTLNLYACERFIPIGGAPKRYAGTLATEPTTGEAWYWEPVR